MEVKIIYNQADEEYMCFVRDVKSIIGYGSTENHAITDFLIRCKGNSLFNQKVINELLEKINYEY